jgi:preprotein translocase subunit SecD
LSISQDNTGAKILEQVTSQNIGKRLAVILDNNVYTAPKIQDKISGGHFRLCFQCTMDEARDLALILKAGPGSCPAHLHTVDKVKLTKGLWLGDIE